MTSATGEGRAASEPSEPREPLHESAPLAWREAPARCYRDARSGESCQSYHQVWQYLRLLGFITTARTNRAFFLERFDALARAGGHVRLLVSASADYAMLAYAAHAWREAGAPLDVTVADRCDTALWLNRWYAQRYGVPLRTVQSDLLRLDLDRPVDVVCTHNVLGRFDAVGRARLVARWHALLRPGGVVVTTQRIRPGNTAVRNVFAEREARELSERVGAAARAWREPIGVEPDALVDAVYDYARLKGAMVIASTREVTELFEGAGFELTVADEGGGVAERQLDRPSSPAGRGMFRMRIVARRL